MSRKAYTRWAAGTAAVVLVFVAGSWTLISGHSGERYRSVPVARGDLLLTVAATGTPNAVVTVQVGTQVSGNILALYADFNSKVTKGQMIARIDPILFEERVQQASAAVDAARVAVANAKAQIQSRQADVAGARANLAAATANVFRAKATLQDAKYKYDRRVALSGDLILSKEDLETAKATYDTAGSSLEASQAQENAAREGIRAAEAQVAVAQTMLASAEAQVRQNEANLRQARTDLDHTYIRAPVDGTVIARRVDVGQTVAASLAAPTIFEIAQDLAKMQVDTNVSEADVGKVQVGQKATFTVDAYPGRIFRGAVREVRKAPVNVQNVITYDVVIAVDNEDLKLYPGMTATVKIVTGQRSGVLRIPNAALRFKPAGEATAAAPAAGGRRNATQLAAYVLDKDNKPRRVSVVLGPSDGNWSEVAGGELKEGDQVIVASASATKSAASQSGPFTPSGGGGPRGGRGF
jgi:HlyD family secretion protein